MKNSLFVPLMVLAMACGNADEQVPLVPKGSWERMTQGVVKKIDTIVKHGKPRTVPRGAKPEIVVKGEHLFIEGQLVAIGAPLHVWKQAIPGVPRCEGTPDMACKWDELGITLQIEGGMVKEFELCFNRDPWWPRADTLPDGTPDPPPPDTRPKNAFPGYFEWDSYGIDGNTRFWEIRASVDPERNVRCDLFTNNCGNTTARFNDKAKIYLELYQTIHENGRLETFAIGR